MSEPNLTNALLDEWAQNPQKTHSKILWKSYPEEWKLL